MRPSRPRWILRARVLLAGAAIVALAAGVITTSSGPADAASARSAANLPGWLHTSGATIRTAKGKAFTIKAVSWFGMETSTCAPDGLWAISLDQGLAKIASLGFNTVRVPFSNQCLGQSTTNSIDATKNPALISLSPLQLLDTIVARARLYGLNIILDQHRPDSSAQSALWYTAQFTEKHWLNDWKRLALRYRSAKNVIGFDLHNEPHGAACWGCGSAAIDWRAAAIRAGNAVLKINPHVLIIVEGIDKQAKTGYYWWGGSLASVATKPVTLRVKHRVVYSPHDYPGSVYPQAWFAAKNYPRNLPGIWTKNWGYIEKKHIAPILLGEFGSKLASTSDKLWLTSMVKYLKKNKMSFGYWAFNPNSADTGGIVADDWTTTENLKLKYLRPLLGNGITVPVLSGPTTVPTTTSTSKPPTASLSATWQLVSSWDTGYVATLLVSSATGATAWTATWPDTTTTSIDSTWGMTCTLNRGVSITCSGVDWGANIAVGYPQTVGMTTTATATPTTPNIAIR